MSNKPILLIGDNADDRDLTNRALKKNNVLNLVAVASNGAAARTMLSGTTTATRTARRSSCST
jgi:two-component system, response regulator